MNGPLANIKVLDLSRVLSGPFCTMLLADLGAEVIKIERPGQGDPARSLGPKVDGESAYFISVNRGKKSITLDLSQEDAQLNVKEMIPHFDVLVENFVPGTMTSFGLDYQHLQILNPRLIYLSLTGFGQDGPQSIKPALDIVVQAMGGIMSVTGEHNSPPIRPGVSLGDSVAGNFSALAIVAALYQREKQGFGQYIDMSMLDCQVTLMENSFSRYFSTGEIPTPLGSRHPAAAPFQAFQGSDKYFVVALLTEERKVWHRFCESIGRLDLLEDPEFLDNTLRVGNVEELAKTLQRTFSTKTAAHWLSVLAKARIPCGPVNNIKDVTDDPQIRHRKMLTSIRNKSGRIWTVANTPFKFSKAVTGPKGASPALGEHTQEILTRFKRNDNL